MLIRAWHKTVDILPQNIHCHVDLIQESTATMLLISLISDTYYLLLLYWLQLPQLDCSSRRTNIVTSVSSMLGKMSLKIRYQLHIWVNNVLNYGTLSWLKRLTTQDILTLFGVVFSCLLLTWWKLKVGFIVCHLQSHLPP
jgi:hypothetical protein